MKIALNTQNTNFYDKVNLNSKVSFGVFLPKLPNDTVLFSQNARAQSIFSKTKKFTINDYKRLSPFAISLLRSSCPEEIKKAAKDSVDTGLFLKQHLDKKYGEGKYVFCCIGTSPSGIARVFEFTGVETKYLPISNLTSYRKTSHFDRYKSQYPSYMNFLENQGISKKEINNSDKTYIFYDYTSTGKGLKNFEYLMKNVFGINSDNIQFRSINDDIKNFCVSDYELYQHSYKYVDDYMFNIGIEKLGGVPHLPVSEIGTIDECCLYESLEAKKFNFCVIDELKRRKNLKFNPCNRGAL